MKTKSREGSGLRDGFLFKYCLSCISASVAESGRLFVNKFVQYKLYIFVQLDSFLFSVTFPLDITKTRLQIQGEKASLASGTKVQPYRGMVKTAYGIGMICLNSHVCEKILGHCSVTINFF